MLYRRFTHFTHKYNYEEKQYLTLSFMVLWYIVSWKPLGRNTEKIQTCCVSLKVSVSMSEREREAASYKYMCFLNKEPLFNRISPIKSSPSPAIVSLRLLPQFLVAPNDELSVPWFEIFIKCECCTLSFGCGKMSKQKYST